MVFGHEGGHGLEMVFSQNFFNFPRFPGQNPARYIQMFQGVIEIGAVKQIIFFKPAGLLNLHQIAVRDFQKFYFILKLGENPVRPAGHRKRQDEKQRKRYRHLRPDTDGRTLVKGDVIRINAVIFFRVFYVNTIQVH